MAAEDLKFNSGECTYDVTKRRYVPQKWYNCLDCKAYPAYGCCEECAKVCHAGHKLSEVRDSNFYCDCGAGSLLPYPEKCKIMPPFDWVKDTKERMEYFLPDLQSKMDALMGKPFPMEIDWDTFRAAASPESTFYQLRRRWGTHDMLYRVMKELVEDNGLEKLGTLKKAVWVHTNDGMDRDERFSIEDDVLYLRASFCCYWHVPQYNELSLFLSIHFVLVEGFKQKIDKCREEAMKKIAGVEIEIDWPTFEYNSEDEKINAKRTVSAFSQAARYDAHRIIKPIPDAFRWTNSSYPGGEDEEIQKAFSKFVVHNRHWTEGARREHKDEGKYVKYNVDSKEVHIYSPYEANSYWDNVQYYDIREVTSQVMWIYRIGDFNTMNVKEHEWKISILRNACDSWLVRSGDFTFLKDLLRFPAFVPKDNHERHAFVALMEYINSADYRATIPADTVALEQAALARHGLPLDSPEEFIAGWATSKVNYKGMKQARLLFVTTRAVYTSAPNYGGAAIDPKRFHRFSLEYFAYTQSGEIIFTSVGGMPSVSGGPSMPSLPGAPNMPSIPGSGLVSGAAGAVGSAGKAVAGAGKAVGGAAADAGGKVGEALGVKSQLPSVPGGEAMPNCPNHAFKLWTDRLAVDDKPKKSFKMPEIPDLKEKVLGAFRAMIDALKSIEMPSLPELPGMPSFSLPDVMDMVAKCKPKRPSLPSMPDMPSADTPEVPDGPGGRNANSCATGSFPNEDQDELPKVREELSTNSSKIKFPLPTLGIPWLLEKVCEMIEAAGDFVMDMPSKFGFMDLLKHLKKTVANTPGLGGIELPGMPELSPVAALTSVKESLGDAGSEILAAIDKMIEGAKELSPVSLPKLPSLPIKKALNAVLEALRGFELPKFDIDFSKFFPNMPNLPGLPAVPLPGVPLPKVEFNKGPVEPEELESVHLPILDGAAQGASNYATMEMALVTTAAARAYLRGDRWPSSPSTANIDNATCTAATVYNSTPLGGLFGTRTGSKPSGDPGPVEDGKL